MKKWNDDGAWVCRERELQTGQVVPPWSNKKNKLCFSLLLLAERLNQKK